MSSTIKRHYVAVTQHTLHAVRTAGNILQFSDECALVEVSSSQRILREWSEDAPVSAIASVAPQPVWWQLVEAEELRRLHSEGELRGFAARLPHGFRGPVEVICCDAASGMPVSSNGDQHGRWLLGVVPGDSLADAASETIERGIITTGLGASALAGIGAAATMVRLNSGGAVLLWNIGHNHSYVFAIGLRGVEAVTRCEVGFKSILNATQESLGLKSPVEAARHFFTNAPAVRDAARRVAEAVAPQLQAAAGRVPASAGPLSFACTGLTNKQGWFGEAIARTLGLPAWSPDPQRFADHLQLRFATMTEGVSPEMLGTMHLAAAHAHGNPAWHPAWGSIKRFAGSAMAAADLHQAEPGIPIISSPPAVPASAIVGRTEASVPASAAVPTEMAPTTPAPIIPSRATPKPTADDARNRSDPKPGTSAPVTPPGVPPQEPLRPKSHPSVPAIRNAPPVRLQPIHLASPAPMPVPTVDAGPKLPPQEALPAAVAASVPPREPVVIVLRKRGYWPHLALALALIGTGFSWKFYLDAEALKSAATQEHSGAADRAGAAGQKEAAVAEQVRRLEEERNRAEKRAQESEQTAAAEVERIRREAETTREAAIARARLEAEEQIRRQLEPELEAARAATRPGILKVATSPAGAEVQVGQRRPLPAPVLIEELPPGEHPVTITLAGHVPVELTAKVRGNKTTDLGVITLERATGTIAVSSEPTGTEFSIRSFTTNESEAPLRRGHTPARFDDLPPGEYVVQFRRAGWPDRTERVTVTRGGTARTATTFESGAVTITSTPPGATITRDGFVVGKTPLTLKDVPAREISYELRANDHEPLKVSGKVVAGRELKLDAKLPALDRLALEAELRTPPRPYVTTPLELGRIPRSTPAFITVTFIVLRDGSLYDISVLEKVDGRIAQRLVEAITKWKFYPGVSHAGYPVNVRVSIPIKIRGD